MTGEGERREGESEGEEGKTVGLIRDGAPLLR